VRHRGYTLSFDEHGELTSGSLDVEFKDRWELMRFQCHEVQLINIVGVGLDFGRCDG